MMEIQTIFTFCLAFFVFAASPGPDNLTILSKTVSSGPAQGIAYGIGVVCSIFLGGLISEVQQAGLRFRFDRLRGVF